MKERQKFEKAPTEYLEDYLSGTRSVFLGRVAFHLFPIHEQRIIKKILTERYKAVGKDFSHYYLTESRRKFEKRSRRK
ncbi:hypothetical protein HN832_03000 [archaeon]|jgi:hypothetical protein|nr:hypothetical protein [archaeon]MBT4373322.1 hypothetical protein [archaeon]MBT4531667.1 hypothetical protein [archaeon]MBT7001155.1 hypothetical protein [archaeon]MBT7282359.1 hypothetical protein [archaeon]